MEILPYHNSMREQIIQIWEQSVRATHLFLAEDDIVFFAALVNEIDFENIPIFCAKEDATLLGFIGIVDKKIEMLFVLPAMMGKGIGKALLWFAIEHCHAYMVDVNEQNIHARNFYEKNGFRVYDRSETDGSGKPYPVLHMKRPKME